MNKKLEHTTNSINCCSKFMFSIALGPLNMKSNGKSNNFGSHLIKMAAKNKMASKIKPN